MINPPVNPGPGDANYPPWRNPQQQPDGGTTQPVSYPTRPPTPNPPHRRGLNRWQAATLVTVVGVLVLGAIGYFVVWPQVRPDAGVALCRGLAEQGKGEDLSAGVDSDGDNTFSEAEYTKLRGQIRSSRDEELREHGTALIDLMWQAQAIDENADEAEQFGAALLLVGNLSRAYTGLTGACAEHGITLPPLTDVNEPAGD
jgi:hypothetical protein